MKIKTSKKWKDQVINGPLTDFQALSAQFLNWGSLRMQSRSTSFLAFAELNKTTDGFRCVDSMWSLSKLPFLMKKGMLACEKDEKSETVGDIKDYEAAAISHKRSATMVAGL